MWTLFFSVGSFFSALAVATGAFGAHALKGKLTPDDMAIFETAARYLTTQSLGILAFSLLMTRIDDLSLKLGALALTLGALIFSGSLFLLVFTGIRTFGAITPAGGAMLILGWLLGCWSAVSTNWQ